MNELHVNLARMNEVLVAQQAIIKQLEVRFEQHQYWNNSTNQLQNMTLMLIPILFYISILFTRLAMKKY